MWFLYHNDTYMSKLDFQGYVSWSDGAKLAELIAFIKDAQEIRDTAVEM